MFPEIGDLVEYQSCFRRKEDSSVVFVFYVGLVVKQTLTYQDNHIPRTRYYNIQWLNRNNPLDERYELNSSWSEDYIRMNMRKLNQKREEK